MKKFKKSIIVNELLVVKIIICNVNIFQEQRVKNSNLTTPPNYV